MSAEPAQEFNGRPAQASEAWSTALDRVYQCCADLQAGAHTARFDTAAHLIEPLATEARFAWLVQTFGLDEIDAAILVVLAAPELDGRLAHLYRSEELLAMTAGASSKLCMQLLCDTAPQRLALRERFAAEHVLLHRRLLVLTERSQHSPDPYRHGRLAVDPQVLGMLLYERALDPRLARYCQLLEARSSQQLPALSNGQWRELARLAQHAWHERRPLHLQFCGARGCGRRAAAQALAQLLGVRVLLADLSWIAGCVDASELLAPLFRQAWFSDALLYVDGIEALGQASPLDLDRLLDAIAQDAGVTILATSPDWTIGSRCTPVLSVFDFSQPDRTVRRTLWEQGLATRALACADADDLADRFRMSTGQIASAVVHAQRRATAQGRHDQVTSEDLLCSVRAQAPRELAVLARKVTPTARWEDLVLPADAQRQLRELCARVSQRRRVLSDWGFDAKLSLGKGTSALFAGGSGTGKTMATEVVAAELELDLYKIDLAAVVSKYIGETEKNLDRIFQAARKANAVLLFDEADAIFGKRSEVRDSHDRYANLEIAYLLQKMDEYEGLAILSTNLKQNLDEAFLRRLTYTVLFPFPDAADRERIWLRIWPADTPLAQDVDFSVLAQRFRLSGGNIKNAALAAAYFAADEGSAVGMRHIVHGIRRELQKVGKTLEDSQIADLLPSAINAAEVRLG